MHGKNINNISFLFLHIYWISCIPFVYAIFILMKRCNYGRYFSLQMSERKEFISQEKTEKKS